MVNCSLSNKKEYEKFKSPIENVSNVPQNRYNRIIGDLEMPI